MTQPYSLTHLADHALERDLAAAAARSFHAGAELLAHLAEFDARGLYAPAGYPSLQEDCLEKLHLSEDSVGRRIHAARAAYRFPVLFHALAQGRLNLTGLNLLAPHLTPQNADELV